MTERMREAGRRASSASRERGIDYRELGRQGGKALLAKHGLEHFAEIGRLGGMKLAGKPRARTPRD
ncbi:MAG: hypothetical protein ACYDAG_06610 [Chloroflexota bacterium]